ncbi:MAG TPA: di-heme oxidoredictase family protein [Acidobacteriota bacterium]|nr:di-heme oxidoredictase family protein [Acidobacteriota bacterium]
MRSALLVVGGTALVALAAISWQASGQSAAVAVGQPMRGITPHEFERFRLGLEDFLEVETSEEGLGPAYNGTSCGVCHSIPAVGGSGLTTEVRFGVRDAAGVFGPPLLPDGTPGDTLFQVFSIPDHACQPVPPADAKVVARRIPIPLFGAGLVEAIPDAEIAAWADPDDLDADGISGRAALVQDLVTGELRVGRFGWKAQLATLPDFAGDAYRNEMGITNEIFPQELAFGIPPEKMALCDPIPDPEDVTDPVTGLSGVDNFTAFMQFLAPPSRDASSGAEQRGEDVFRSIGCSACHVPTLRTGPSNNPLFDRQPVPLFSDLLLHDIGTGDGIGQADAAPSEIRTPALWGLRFRRILLHDGSAGSTGEAIQRHGVEAAAARKAYRRLDKSSRQALQEFLRSL